MKYLSEAMDNIRRAEYARLEGKERRYIKGSRYMLLSNRENLTLSGQKSLSELLAVNKYLKTLRRLHGILLTR